MPAKHFDIDSAIRSHTLSKSEKKKVFQTNTMKPMSAHDERTLDTAVAMANEITTKSMNDLDGEARLPSSPGDRSKFHFKFPQRHHNPSHDLDKDALARNAERRNFSEEANSVPDIQSTITEESKLAYTSLIEDPTPATSLITHILDTKGVHKPTTIPKPAPRTHESRPLFHSLQKPARTGASSTEDADHIAAYYRNELPLPPRSTKPKLVDKPRHIRKHPLKLPAVPAPEPNRPIIYQNAPAAALSRPPQCDADVCDGIDKLDTNPFTSTANPFNCFMYDATCGLGYDHNGEGDDQGGLIKDCLDHVSVEDLLEFADQKPCGRQRGVESDEVRIMNKVLKQHVTPQQCLEALELSDWDVHLAIKVVRVRNSAERESTLEDCAAELQNAGGDVAKAAALLNNKHK